MTHDAIAGRPVGQVPAAIGGRPRRGRARRPRAPLAAPDFVVHAGDTLVAAGPTQGIEAVFRAVRDGVGLAERPRRAQTRVAEA